MPRKLHMARLFLLVIAFGRGVISYSSCLPLGHDHNAATSSSPPRENGSKFFDLGSSHGSQRFEASAGFAISLHPGEHKQCSDTGNAVCSPFNY